MIYRFQLRSSQLQTQLPRLATKEEEGGGVLRNISESRCWVSIPVGDRGRDDRKIIAVAINSLSRHFTWIVYFKMAARDRTLILQL